MSAPGSGGRVGPPRLRSGRGRPDAAISVVVPVHQGGDTVAATLASVLAHPGDDLEVVVLDNASTDRTAEVLAAVTDPRVVIWDNPGLVPMLENFNRAVALASAPLVKVVCADDLVEPGALAEQVRVLQADPALAMVAGREHLVDERGALLARSRFLRGLVGTFDHRAVVRAAVCTGGNPVGADVAVTFRHAAFRAAGGYGGPETFADLDLWLRLLEHGHFRGQAETVGRFRVRAGSRSAAAEAADDHARARYLAALAHATPGIGPHHRLALRLSTPSVRWRRRTLFALARRRERRALARVPRRGGPGPAVRQALP